MRVVKNILDLVGQTPMVELSSKINPTQVRILAKLEGFNPGGSVKDRIGISMIGQAEKDGKLKPGMPIVEPTSGNTGVGIALVCLQRGYKLIVTMPDKVSKEKQELMRAYGAEVHMCPTAVEPDDPRSYYSLAAHLAKERNGVLLNQYDNKANPLAHYRTTGPEIWKQTGGKLDAFACGVGTGGTISGTGRYLKEQNPKVKIVGVDPEGSMLYTHFYKQPHNVHTYLIEGIGEDIIPGSLDFSVIDEMVRVYDKESYDMVQDIFKKEGLFVGISSGAALVGALRYAEKMKQGTLVILLPDSGRNYLQKAFSDDWLREKGLL
ncbi:cysteine synthase family protein [Candidatus Acetothermia bacterium]|nr:cysteine synthase family protein [Candidatus Acetothermia bacterium]MBI3643210.1 cysteine synthase family protein [Candidatus Acetothermia bacterium]